MASTLTTHPNNFSGLKCSPSTLICREKTVIVGDVTIGVDCVIHPTINIIARKGPIVIGDNNLIEERVTIINNRSESMIIGNHNVFEVDCYTEASKIGNHNILESKSRIGPNVEITENCVIGAGCDLTTQNYSGEDKLDKFSPQTIISGRNLDRRVVKQLPTSSANSQLDFLRKIIPNYQKLWRPPNLPLTPQQ